MEHDEVGLSQHQSFASERYDDARVCSSNYHLPGVLDDL